MPFDLLAVYSRLPVFALVAGRLGGLIMFQPAIGGQAVPVNVRVLFVLGLAALVTPVLPLDETVPDRPAAIALAMGNELLLGVLLGLIVRMCFLGLQIGGQLVAQESGLAFGQVADPSTGLQQTMLSSFYVQLGGVVFLILGGHRALVTIALDTFHTIPLLGDAGTVTLGVDVALQALTLGTEIAVRIAAPALLTLFLINAAMGFIARTVPQINIIILGFSIKGMIAFLMLAVSLPIALDAFAAALDETVGWCQRIVQG